MWGDDCKPKTQDTAKDKTEVQCLSSGQCHTVVNAGCNSDGHKVA